MAPRPKKPLKPVLGEHGSTPAEPTLGEVIAIQALAQGRADDEQQRIAWRFILEKACALPSWPYRGGEDGTRETDIGLGRQFVGHQLVSVTKMNVSAMKKRESEI